MKLQSQSRRVAEISAQGRLRVEGAVAPDTTAVASYTLQIDAVRAGDDP